MTRASTNRGSTHTNLIIGAAEALRERSAAGVTIDEVLQRSGAPRGSVYYYFPEGRSQIGAEALEYVGQSITSLIDEAAANGGRYLVEHFVDFWDRVLAENDFTAGCPVVAAAIGSAEDGPQLTSVAGAIFGQWRKALTRAFEVDGCEQSGTASLAITSIAALEGAVVLCRATRDLDPLRQVHTPLEFLFESREFVRRNGVPIVTQ